MKDSQTLQTTLAGYGLPGKPRVAVLFYRFGPYHHARLKAAGSQMDVTGVEYSNVDTTYNWDLVEGAEGFKRLTLFPGQEVRELSSSRISTRINEVLNQLRPQVVAIPGWYDRCSLAALRWCDDKGVPAVIMSESTAWDAKRNWFKEFLKGRVIKLCASGLVGGKAHAEYLENLGIDRANIFLGYDAVDNDYFSAKADEIRSQEPEIRGRLGLPENYFLASARFIVKKNLPRLIQAYARYHQLASNRDRQNSIKPWALILLGDGAMRLELDAVISKLQLHDYVHMPGFKQYDELPAYFGLAKTFIHTSTIEQWGLVVNEAMASGLPVLVSDRCGCAMDLVQEGRNGYCFDPYDVEALAQLMLKVSAENFPLAEFASASRQIILDWSPEKFAVNLKAACHIAILRGRSKNLQTGRLIINFLIHAPNIFQPKPVEKPDAPGRQNLQGSSKGHARPNFFIIGAPKSGTTSLSEYLKDHPNIYFSPVKEPHFFDQDTSKRLKLNMRTYLSLFSRVSPDVHLAVGEGSTGYLFSKVAVPEILKFNPNAMFIVLLRNPMDLVQSWHSEMYFEGVENVADFEKAWRLEPERRKGEKILSSCWEPKKLLYSEWGKLGDQIERLFSVVNRNRVKVILFDDFVADTKGIYEQILSFLAVPSDKRNDFPIVNENKMIRYPWLQRKLAFTANHFRWFRVVSGLKLSLGLGIFQKILVLNSKPSSRKSISPELRAELTEFFSEDIQKLSRLLDRDLSHWRSKPVNPRASQPLQKR